MDEDIEWTVTVAKRGGVEDEDIKRRERKVGREDSTLPALLSVAIESVAFDPVTVAMVALSFVIECKDDDAQHPFRSDKTKQAMLSLQEALRIALEHRQEDRAFHAEWLDSP